MSIELKTISPHGDLYINISTKCKRYLVNAATLRNGSEVFDKMLCGQYKEGEAISVTSPGNLELYDDDTEALDLLLSCMHLHHVPGPISGSLVAAFAKLLDKYLCGQFFKHFAIGWLSDVSKDAANLVGQINAAWTLRLEKEFRRACLAMIRNHPSSACFEKTDRDESLPSIVIEMLTRQRTMICQRLTTALSISFMVKENHCDCHARTSTEFDENIRASMVEVFTSDFGSIFKKLISTVTDMETSVYYHCCNHKRRIDQKISAWHVREPLLNNLKSINYNMDGLCLHCCKAGALSALDCVVNHSGIAKRHVDERSVDDSDGDEDP